MVVSVFPSASVGRDGGGSKATSEAIVIAGRGPGLGVVQVCFFSPDVSESWGCWFLGIRNCVSSLSSDPAFGLGDISTDNLTVLAGQDWTPVKPKRSQKWKSRRDVQVAPVCALCRSSSLGPSFCETDVSFLGSVSKWAGRNPTRRICPRGSSTLAVWRTGDNDIFFVEDQGTRSGRPLWMSRYRPNRG